MWRRWFISTLSGHAYVLVTLTAPHFFTWVGGPLDATAFSSKEAAERELARIVASKAGGTLGMRLRCFEFTEVEP